MPSRSPAPRPKSGSAADPLAVGKLAVSKGYLSEPRLRLAAKLKARSPKAGLGQLLVSKGWLTREQWSEVVAEFKAANAPAAPKRKAAAPGSRRAAAPPGRAARAGTRARRGPGTTAAPALRPLDSARGRPGSGEARRARFGQPDGEPRKGKSPMVLGLSIGGAAVVLIVVLVLVLSGPDNDKPGTSSTDETTTYQGPTDGDKGTEEPEPDPLEQEWLVLQSYHPRTEKEARRHLVLVDEFLEKVQGTGMQEKVQRYRERIRRRARTSLAKVEDEIFQIKTLAEIGRAKEAFESLDELAERPDIKREPELLEKIEEARGEMVRDVRDQYDRIKKLAVSFAEKGKYEKALRYIAFATEFYIPEIVEEATRLENEYLDKATELVYEPPFPMPDETELARWRTEGEARLSEARQERLRRQENETQRIEEQRERLLAETQRNPIDLKLMNGSTLPKCRVSKYDGRFLTVKPTDGGTLKLVLDQLSGDAIYKIRKLMLDPADARGWYELGRDLALRGAEWAGKSIEAYRKAAELDPALEAKLPNFNKIRTPPRLFHATTVNISQEEVKLDYRFQEDDEAQDFQGRGVEASIEDRVLELEGQGNFGVSFREIPFRDRFVLEIAPGTTGNTWVGFGFQLGSADGKRSWFGVRLDPAHSRWAFRESGDHLPEGTEPEAEWETAPADCAFRFQVQGDRFVLELNGEAVQERMTSGIEDIRIMLGGIVVKEEEGETPKPDEPKIDWQEKGKIFFEHVLIEGNVDENWRSKVASSERALLDRVLDRGMMAGEVRGELQMTKLLREEVWNAVSQEWKTEYEEASKALYEFLSTRSWQAYSKASERIQVALSKADGHPGVVFLKAEQLRQTGDWDSAVDFYEEALELDKNHLLEAEVAIAHFRLESAEIDEAWQKLDEVLEQRPDLVSARRVRGQACIYRGLYDQAVEELELAQLLDPADWETGSLLRIARKIKAGPAWDEIFTAEPRQHNHVVKTDIRDRAELYAAHIGAIWDEYVSVCSVEPDTPRPIDVFLFNDQERFQHYSEVTLNSSMQNVLGYFHPLYWQIHLFEEKVEDTLGVLYHEGFHYYGRIVFETWPIWVNEGLAEYFCGTLIEDGVVQERGRILWGRLNNLLDAMEAGYHPQPFDTIATQSQAEFYGMNIGLNYAQAWTLVHYFLEGGNEDLKDSFMNYLVRLRKGMDNREAIFECFSGETAPKKWVDDWRQYVYDLRKRRGT